MFAIIADSHNDRQELVPTTRLSLTHWDVSCILWPVSHNQCFFKSFLLGILLQWWKKYLTHPSLRTLLGMYFSLSLAIAQYKSSGLSVFRFPLLEFGFVMFWDKFEVNWGVEKALRRYLPFKTTGRLTFLSLFLYSITMGEYRMNFQPCLKLGDLNKSFIKSFNEPFDP